MSFKGPSLALLIIVFGMFISSLLIINAQMIEKLLVTITFPDPNQKVKPGTLTIFGTSSDNAGGSGVRDVYTRLDTGAYLIATPQAPGNWSSWSRSYNITTTGSHNITARATDNAGNIQWTAVIPFTVT